MTNEVPGIDPQIMNYMRQEQLRSMLSAAGQTMMQASYQGRPFGQALVAGLGAAAQTSGGSTLLKTLQLQSELARMQGEKEKQTQKREQRFAQKALGAGNRYDPSTDILWNQPPTAGQQPEAASPQDRERLVSQAYPEAYARSQVAELFPEEPEYLAPTVVSGPDGKPMLIRFPKGRAGAPQPVSGYAPYEKPGETERFEPIYAADGKTIIGQKNLRTGRVVDDPRAGGGSQEPADLRMARAFVEYGVAPDMASALRMATQQVTKDPNGAYFSLIGQLSQNAYTPEAQMEAAQRAADIVREVYPDWRGPAQPAAPPPTVEADAGGFLDRLFGRRPGAEAMPGPQAAQPGGVTIPIAPDLPTLATELNALPDAAKEARLRKLLAEDPEGFEALVRFLETR